MNEHEKLLSELFNLIQDDVYCILDAGSGKTSLNNLIKYFPFADIDAIVYYGDTRKINSIHENVKGKYSLIEKDIVKDKIDKKYDLVLAHLLLGEASIWGNTTINLLNKLLEIDSKYFIIFDIKEDPSIDYKELEQVLSKYEIIKKAEIKKEEPQVFKNFTSYNYVAYLIRK